MKRRAARKQTNRRRMRKAAVARAGKSVREMTAEFNARVPQVRKLGLAFWWLKEHVSPFEVRAAAIRMLDRLEAAMEAVLANRRKRLS